jgi:hypothetical protein
VPVSKTKLKNRNKAKRAERGQMSADAKRKIRRWTFRVDVTGEQGVKSFTPPTLTVGTNESAVTAANQLAKEVSALPQFKDCKVNVITLAHETVSYEILTQMNGLNAQGNTLASALRIATIDLISKESSEEELEVLKTDSTAFDKRVEERMLKIVTAIQSANQRQQLIDAGLDPDAVVSGAEQPAAPVPAEFAAAAAPVQEEAFPDGVFGEEAA